MWLFYFYSGGNPVKYAERTGYDNYVIVIAKNSKGEIVSKKEVRKKYEKNKIVVYIFILILLFIFIILYYFFGNIITREDVMYNNRCQGTQLITFNDKKINNVFCGNGYNEIYLSEQNNTYKRGLLGLRKINELYGMIKISNEKDNIYVLFNDGSVKRFIDNKCIDIEGLPDYK